MGHATLLGRVPRDNFQWRLNRSEVLAESVLAGSVLVQESSSLVCLLCELSALFKGSTRRLVTSALEQFSFLQLCMGWGVNSI
jgi:hypothetical protein